MEVKQKADQIKLEAKQQKLFDQIFDATKSFLRSESKTKAKSGMEAVDFVLSGLQGFYPYCSSKYMDQFTKDMLHLHIIEALNLAFSNIETFSNHPCQIFYQVCEKTNSNFDLFVCIGEKDPHPVLLELERYCAKNVTKIESEDKGITYYLNKHAADKLEVNGTRKYTPKYHRIRSGAVSIYQLKEKAGERLSRYCEFPYKFDCDMLKRELVVLYKSDLERYPVDGHDAIDHRTHEKEIQDMQLGEINIIFAPFTRSELTMVECKLFTKTLELFSRVFCNEPKMKANTGKEALDFVLQNLEKDVYSKFSVKEMNQFSEALFQYHVVHALKMSFSNLQIFTEQKCSIARQNEEKLKGRFDLLVSTEKDQNPVLVEFKLFTQDELIGIKREDGQTMTAVRKEIGYVLDKRLSESEESRKKRQKIDKMVQEHYRLEYFLERAKMQVAEYCDLPPGFDCLQIRREVVALIGSRIEQLEAVKHMH